MSGAAQSPRIGSVARRARVLAGDPIAAPYRIAQRLWPEALVRRNSRRAQRLGIDRLYLLLSFDCDTPADADAAERVWHRVAEAGARPALAVPGELLERSADTYRRLAEVGAEFINHGYREHTFYEPDGRYAGGIFYEELTPAEVRADILEGDRALRDALGVRPRGFRAPHFGTFQRARDIGAVHRVCRELEYEYSSSTVPLWSFRRGPLFRHLGVAEIPVTGRGSAPLHILDSWIAFAAPDRNIGPDDYRDEARRAAQLYSHAGPGILNYYVDPAHVEDRPEFFDAVAAWTAVAEPCGYAELVRRASAG